MAVHGSIQSMLRESFTEMILVAEYCINFRKDPKIWGSCGRYGYPAAILLFSIADSIGSYIIEGSTREHFDILNHKEYYNLNLDKIYIDIIYEKYRCLLTHSLRMEVDFVLDIGHKNDSVFKIKNGTPYFNLLPFLKISKDAMENFLKNIDSIIQKEK
jgi:hypothetical protein